MAHNGFGLCVWCGIESTKVQKLEITFSICPYIISLLDGRLGLPNVNFNFFTLD
jgi:hypothetical protein